MYGRRQKDRCGSLRQITEKSREEGNRLHPGGERRYPILASAFGGGETPRIPFDKNNKGKRTHWENPQEVTGQRKTPASSLLRKGLITARTGNEGKGGSVEVGPKGARGKWVHQALFGDRKAFNEFPVPLKK